MSQATDVVTTEAEIRSVISGQFSSQQGKIVDHSQDANCVECFQIDAGSAALGLAHSQLAPCAADVAVI